MIMYCEYANSVTQVHSLHTQMEFMQFSQNFFNSEVSTPKKQHLMIFMRVLLTTIIGPVPSKGFEY